MKLYSERIDQIQRRCRDFPTRSLIAFSIAVIVGVAVASQDTSVDMRRYFGKLPVIPAALFVCAMGITSLYLLQKQLGFCVSCLRVDCRGWLMAVGLAVPFMATVTLLDLTLKFPEDLNVNLPTALIFYPAMSFVAQIALHVAPFGFLVWILTRVDGQLSNRRMWICIAVASLPEAIFQYNGTRLAGDAESILSAFVAAQLLLFGLAELYLFRRYDFVSMYLFRLTYYGYWHILWGNLRI